MNVAVPARTGLFYGYILVGYSFTVLFLASSFFLHSRGIFFPHWMADFGVDRTEISLAITLTLFTGSCLAPVIGYLIDRFPMRVITSIGALWLATGYTLIRMADSYYGFLACLLIFQSIGWASVGPLVHTKLMVNWFDRNRGMAIGVAIMGISVAGVVMPTVATYFTETYGWRDTYILYGAILAFVFVPLALLLIRQSPADVGQLPDGETNAPPAIERTGPEQTGFAVYREFLSSRPFWSVVLTFTLMNGVYSAMITHLPSYLTTERGFDMYDASMVLGVAGAFAIGGKIVFGWMMDHIRARTTVLIGVTAYFLSTLVFITATNYEFIMLAAGLFGLGFGGMVPVRSVLLSRIFGVARFSRVNGLFSFFLAPATFWVLATGYIADRFGTYTVAFEVWACCFFLAGVVTVVVRLPDRQDAVA